jgi:hypothetical protein
VEQHPDKTFIGRIERGFMFLGYWITEKGVTEVAPSTWEVFQECVARLYEQNAPLAESRRSVEQIRSALEAVGARDVSDSFEWPDFGPVHYVFVPPMLLRAAQLT